MRTCSKVVGFLSVLLIFMFGVTFRVSAEEKFYAKEGFYMGITLPYNTIGGDFEGNSMLIGPDEIILVPKVEGDFGWGIALGGRGKKWAGELSYLRSTHNVTWLGAQGEAVYNLVTLDFKRYFLVDKSVQPYILLGWIPSAWLTVKDGSADVFGRVGDATFIEIFSAGLDLGGGLAFYLHPRVAINTGILYRLVYFATAEGVIGEPGDIEDSLNASGLSYNVGLTFTF